MSKSPAPVDGSSLVKSIPYTIQLVRQINHGPQESIRYFIPMANDTDFVEAMEDHLLKWNFEKNFRCEKHNKFFEVNLYQTSPTNTHHWRVNLARPSRDIDLAFW
ncbi:hypothetical protein BDV96DRAFT_617900 [Lophiotrema nucula]|uniref:Uncharacterized protein n=1 Tax=Lophiotrema nucula TaxID=690887 RepID=A0A6A5YEB9_9PLEO|nr:hypothetical protein BDV96DRAFT_617900 [Lophiotrema nucula]